MSSLCSSCVWKSIVATVPADLSSRVPWCWIEFDFDLTLITVDTHMPMLGWLLRGRDSICFCLVFMAWHGGGCVFVADCKYAAGCRDDAERVARAYGDCVRRVYDDCSR